MAHTFFTTNVTTPITAAASFDSWYLRQGLTWSTSGSLFNSAFSSNVVTIAGTASASATGLSFKTTSLFTVTATGSVFSNASSGNAAVVLGGVGNSVSNSGEIFASFGYAILAGETLATPGDTQTANTIQNHGRIAGGNGGVFLGLFGATGDTLINYGRVELTGPEASVRRGKAVIIEGNNSLVVNHGTISASVVGAGAVRVGTNMDFTANNGTNSRVVNHGVIESLRGDAITLVGLNLGTAQIENFGTLIGNVRLTERGDAIVNRGLIQGDVIMGAGNDIYDGQGGRIEGTVQGGDGADTYITSQADLRIVETGTDVDMVLASIDFSLETYEGIETLVLTGASALNGEGNNLDNSLTGNAGANMLSGGLGNDTLSGGQGFDRLIGGEGNDSLIGGDGHDLMEGGVGNDVIIGQTGDDTLIGGAGADQLTGGEHDDVLVGGAGRDTLSGGSGEDVFLFRRAAELGSVNASADTITDFVSNSDVIDLSGIDANTVLAGNQAFLFIGSAAFSNVAGELRYTTGSGPGLLSGDTNGDGVADLLLRLGGSPALLAGDLVL